MDSFRECPDITSPLDQIPIPHRSIGRTDPSMGSRPGSDPKNFPTLVHLLRHRAALQPDDTAFIFLQHGLEMAEKGRLSYKELDRTSQAVAAQLRDRHFPGDRVLLLYPPGLEIVSAYLGCLYAGVVAVPYYLHRSPKALSQLQRIAADAQASSVLTVRSLVPMLSGLFSGLAQLEALPLIPTDPPSPPESSDRDETDWKEIALEENAIAFLQYTSGSTATPKGVMVSHGNLMHNLEQIYQAFGHSPRSRGVIWLPPYHDMGLIGGLLEPIYGGFPVVLLSALDFVQRPVRWLQAISRYRATTSGGPTFAYSLCIERVTPEQRAGLDLRSWKVAFCGAEPVNAQVLERFASSFEGCGFRREAFFPCYGLAEATLFVTGGALCAAPTVCPVSRSALEKNQVQSVSDRNEEDKREVVGCGWTRMGQTLAIVDPESKARCSDDQVGEIWVSGPSLARGYWNRPIETEETFYARLNGMGDRTFLRTGDLGFIKDGNLFIVGRLKDLIIIRGKNHAPGDIEWTVMNSHPALRPFCGAAFGVDLAGEEQLVIVQEVERSSLKTLDAEGVVGQIRQAVARDHGLQAASVILVHSGGVPKTSSGKIQRRLCRERFLRNTLDRVADSRARLSPRQQAPALNHSTE